jgi:hypothetical protein
MPVSWAFEAAPAYEVEEGVEYGRYDFVRSTLKRLSKNAPVSKGKGFSKCIGKIWDETHLAQETLQAGMLTLFACQLLSR